MLYLTTSYFPPIVYMKALAQAGQFTLTENENFQKRSFRNRTHIVTSQGVEKLSVPVCHEDKDKGIRNLRISYAKNWQKDHWGAICAAYNNSPYFLYYREELQALLFAPQVYLFDLNLSLLKFLCRKLRLTAEYVPWGELREEERTGGLAQIFLPQASTDILQPYLQTFDTAVSDRGNLSVLDLLCNLGPEATSYLNIGKTE